MVFPCQDYIIHRLKYIIIAHLCVTKIVKLHFCTVMTIQFLQHQIYNITWTVYFQWNIPAVLMSLDGGQKTSADILALLSQENFSGHSLVTQPGKLQRTFSRYSARKTSAESIAIVRKQNFSGHSRSSHPGKLQHTFSRSSARKTSAEILAVFSQEN